MHELKTWQDLADKYSMVLFNQAIELCDGEVLQEWQDQHVCDSLTAKDHLENCKEKDCKICKDYIDDFGDDPYCECQPYQWFAIDLSEFDAEYLKKEFNLDVFFSDCLGIYILVVHHFGTAWKMLNLKGGYAI